MATGIKIAQWNHWTGMEKILLIFFRLGFLAGPDFSHLDPHIFLNRRLSDHFSFVAGNHSFDLIHLVSFNDELKILSHLQHSQT